MSLKYIIPPCPPHAKDLPSLPNDKTFPLIQMAFISLPFRLKKFYCTFHVSKIVSEVFTNQKDVMTIIKSYKRNIDI